MAKKKEKVTYYDDGRTVADMSGLPPRSRLRKHSTSSAKEKWDTYWAAVKMMLGPMLVFITAMGVVYMLLYLLFSLM